MLNACVENSSCTAFAAGLDPVGRGIARNGYHLYSDAEFWHSCLNH